jgi:aryl-alcohol dehydrogenase (NADP+)
MTSVQPRYNLLYRHPELELLPAAEEFGVGVIVYSPMAGGFLTGKHSRDGAAEGTRFGDDFRASTSYKNSYWHDAYFDAVEELVTVCAKYNITAYQLGIVWVLSHSAVTACIVGGRTKEQVQANLSNWESPVPQAALDAAQEIADRARDQGPNII